jgi:hypothetical protein
MVQDRRFSVAVRLLGGNFARKCLAVSYPRREAENRRTRVAQQPPSGAGPRRRAGDQGPGTTGQGPR